MIAIKGGPLYIQLGAITRLFLAEEGTYLNLTIFKTKYETKKLNQKIIQKE